MAHDSTKSPELHHLCTPPSHPSSLGEVWTGETAPTPQALAEVLTAKPLSSTQYLDKPRHDK
jgi:hypothetical protein